MTLSPVSRGIEQALKELDLHSEVPLNDDISLEPEQFYNELGHLKHPRTGQEVPALTEYQVKVWKALHKWKRVFVVKSNKIGLTTSTLMADFQLALLPSSNRLSTRGYDTLLIGQTIQHAKEHLYTLRKMVLNSEKYGKYLVTKPTELLLRDETTKVTVLFIRNPENEMQPSRIIGLGLNNAGSILSWKNVKHIHISDPTAAEGDYTEALNAAMTRLANTDGSMIIETVPNGPQGKIYEMYQQFKDQPEKVGQFKVFEIPASEAVKAGVINQEFLDQEKQRLGVLYPQYYDGQFIAGAGNIFEPYLVDMCVQHYELAMGLNEKIMAVDPAYGSSKFAILGGEIINGVFHIKEARQFERPSPSVMLEMVASLYHRDRYSICYVDGSQPGLIQDLMMGADNRQPIVTMPVNFSQELNGMVLDAAKVVKEQKVRIHPAYSDLVTQLKTIQFNVKGVPDKNKIKFDLGDCFLMCSKHVAFGASAYKPYKFSRRGNGW
jgi:hypothetical protein